MEAFVISLASSSERRNNVKQVLGDVQIPFSFIDAVDGRIEGSHPLLDSYNESQFIYYYGRKAAPGEIGCYASHILAWQKCVELNKPIIVFEDDMTVEAGVHDAFNACEQLIEKYGFIRLEKTRKKPQYKVASVGEQTLYNFLKVPQCATCYAISPAVAQTFLKHSQEIRMPVDVFIRNVWLHKQAIYGLQPYYVSAGRLGSIIGKRQKYKDKPLITKIICLGYKARNMLMNAYQQAIFFLTR